MKVLKDFFPAQSGRTVVFLLAIVFLLVTGGIHSDIYASDKIMREPTPEITVNRTNLNFGAVKQGSDSTSSSTSPQTLLINNTGGGTLDWSIHTDDDWLICSPNYGTNSGKVKVYAATCPLPPGNHKTNISIYGHGASNSPQTVPVEVNVYAPGGDAPPFGTFETPVHNSTVNSSIPVTGWVLDDVQVDNVKIYNGSSYVGDAVFVEGARPDVAVANPDTPLNYRAGWGYMMLTNFLPNGGNGTYHITAIATDTEGNQTTLGTKTILCDNAHAVKPFGAIDTPTQGGAASGSNYLNWGWALTPRPNHIPTDGSTINVWVDGVNKGHPSYNRYRKDIAQFFPDYENSDGAAGLFEFDTTGYADGVYTIQWTATDSANNTDGIGSRYFTIDNTGNRNMNKATSAPQNHKCSPPIRIQRIKDLPIDNRTPVKMKKGFEKDIQPREIYADHDGLINIKIKELGRIELDLSASFTDTSKISGYLLVGDSIQSLPIGSTLKDGVFYWMPGLAFFGKYHLVFIEQGGPYGEEMNRKDFLVEIGPKCE
jgi:hypothetical protein